MVEGFASTTGAALEWMKKSLELFDDFAVFEETISSIPTNGGVYFFPALTGYISPPYRNPTSRASFMGVSASTTKDHMMRAVAESIPYAINAIFEDISENMGVEIKDLKISGGVTRCGLLNQLLSDLIGQRVVRSSSVEASSLGAAQLAGLYMNVFTMEQIYKHSEGGTSYFPAADREAVLHQFHMWQKAANRSLDWFEKI